MWDYKPFTRRLRNSVVGFVLGLSFLACDNDNLGQNARTLDTVVAEEDSGEDTFDAYTARDVGVSVDLGSDIRYDNGSKEDTYNLRRRDVGVGPDLSENYDLQRDSGLVRPDLTEEDTDSGRSQELRAIACREEDRINDSNDPHYGWCRSIGNVGSPIRMNGCDSFGNEIQGYTFDYGIRRIQNWPTCDGVSVRYSTPGIYDGSLTIYDAFGQSSIDRVEIEIN